jgi:hypothetical protein
VARAFWPEPPQTQVTTDSTPGAVRVLVLEKQIGTTENTEGKRFTGTHGRALNPDSEVELRILA